MLSYQWDDQPTIIKIKEALTAAGYQVWLDLEQMGGSTLAAMADAVEGSVVVCVALSEKYKNSANCRLEGEYAQQQRKLIVPLMMQKNWRPSGWLGILLGAKLYFEFTDSSEGAFQSKVAEVIKQIKGLGVQPSSSLGPTSGTSAPTTTTVVETKAPEYVEWNEEKTMNWIQKIGGQAQSFRYQLDGGCLKALVRLRQQDPSTNFVTFLLTHVTPHLPSALKLGEALLTLR